MNSKSGRAMIALGLACGFLPSATKAQTATTGLDSPSFGSFLESSIPFQTNRGRNTGVLERERPEYDPIGIRTGGFLVYPRVQVGVGVSDNIEGSTNNPTTDAFFTLDPTVRVESDWSRNALSASAGGAFRRLVNRDERNEDGFFANLSGRYDIADSTNVIGTIGTRRAYEAQYSGSFPTNSVTPIQFSDTYALARGQVQGARTRFTLSGDVHSLDYQDATGVSGALIDQDFRDRTLYRGTGRAEYAVRPDAAVFGQIGYQHTDYRRPLSGFSDNRDGDTLELLAGATLDITALIRATIGGGYIRRSFDSARFASLSGFAYDLRLEYFPTELTTITLVARRSAEDSIVTGSSGFFANTFQLRADHELLRNVLLFGEGTFQDNRFKGLSRSDQVYQAVGGARWLVNRRLNFAGAVSYIDRDSRGTIAGQRFNELRGTVSAVFQY